MKIRKSLMLLLALGAVTLSQAQTVKVLPAQSKITVSGTSTLHDWENGLFWNLFPKMTHR